MQTTALWLSPLLIAGGAAGVWAYNRHRQKTNVHIMAINLVRGVPLTPKEKETMLDLLTPPPSQRGTPSWLKKWIGQCGISISIAIHGKNTVFYLLLLGCNQIERVQLQ